MGMKKVRAEVRNEDRKFEKIETAKKMLFKAMPIDLISDLCGLSTSEINEIKANMTI